MKKITPFDFPLLNNEICQYLSRKDLACCALVSKAWAAWFLPTLWRDLNCRYRMIDVPTFSRHREHIRVLRNVSMENGRAIRDQLPFLQLQRLEFGDNSNNNGVHRTEMRALPALETISALQHLQITLSLDRDNVFQQWIRTLKNPLYLESLTLSCEQFLDGKVVLGVLRACQRLERLSLRLSGREIHTDEEDRQQYVETRAEIERMPEMQLRELSFISCTDLAEDNILQPLLKRCPRMEKLELAMMRQIYTLQHLSHALRENKLPRLRYFLVGWLGSGNFQEAFAEVLSHVKCGLETFEFHSCPSGVVTQSLIQHHARSLTTLHFDSGILLCGFSSLMTGLLNLRSFRGTVSVDRDSEDIPDKHWACYGLRDLRLRLGGLFSIGSWAWEESTTKPWLDYVFSEVAQLTSLQVLDIRCDMHNLYLDQHGYLTQLADLKELKVIHLGKISHKTFGTQEALWMAKNWPKLLQVTALNAPAIFKKTLREKRPLVEIDKY
ncbi:MAG: hypothetical protein J3Q66DRAFT_366347 [Benniella sp.]|nr:MAG: hypothetical protein J3Q66DRAFT_366347 [Benniella sp.]